MIDGAYQGLVFAWFRIKIIELSEDNSTVSEHLSHKTYKGIVDKKFHLTNHCTRDNNGQFVEDLVRNFHRGPDRKRMALEVHQQCLDCHWMTRKCLGSLEKLPPISFVLEHIVDNIDLQRVPHLGQLGV
ncbi:hypothetical protein Tco_1067362 [Tanacetum coccineum]|uniref:Uncharacterized protein n=1 Tax=Tanacetum coccineum TaxID=301880 RepID=A0ABQ5HD82_9ASTR